MLKFQKLHTSYICIYSHLWSALICSQTINSMSKKMRGILHIILDMVIDSYGVSRDEPHIGGTDALLHMIKYTAPEKEEPALGLSEHTDINYLTILCQNEVDGLSLKTKEGEWFPVNPGRQFVVFVGQSLRVCIKFHTLAWNL